MKARIFLIPSFIAAGFCAGDDGVATANSGLTEQPRPDGTSLFRVFRLDHRYNLAGHRSHSSHGSHRSHRSSSGGGLSIPSPAPAPRYTPPPLSPPPSAYVPAPSRNLSSTPPTSILPSTPAITPQKTLPGNSQKFTRIVEQVQLGLLAYGYYSGVVDGMMGPETKAAISKFQSAFNHNVTGTITPEVLDAFGIEAK